MNKAIIIGNLVANPELKYTPNGMAICSIRVATNEVWYDKQNQKQEKAEFHRIVVFGKQAETCNKFLRIGQKIGVEGKITTRHWEDKTGVKRYMTEINANHVEFLSASGDKREAPVVKPESIDEVWEDIKVDTNPLFTEQDIPF